MDPNSLRITQGGLNQRRVERISQASVIVCVGESQRDFDRVRNLILSWLAEKAKTALPPGMLEGRSDVLDTLGAQRVETISIDTPRLWAARQDDNSNQVAGRTWVTEIFLQLVGPRSLRLSYGLHCVSLGSAQPFTRSVPRFLRLIGTNHTIELDDIETSATAIEISDADQVEQLVDQLIGGKRKHPIVGISVFEGDAADYPLIDSDKLAQRVFGCAHVRLISPEAADILTERLGRSHSVFGGGVRIWWPDFACDKDPYSHRLWVRSRIEDDGEEPVREAIAECILRRSAGRRDPELAVPSFSDVRRAIHRNTIEHARDQGTSGQDLLRLYEEEIEDLRMEIFDMKQQHNQDYCDLEGIVRSVENERDAARAEIFRLRCRLQALESTSLGQKQAPEVNFPESLTSLEGWAREFLEPYVIVLPRALRAAKKSDFEDVRFVYQALLLLRNHYVPYRIKGGSAHSQSWERALKEMGLEYSKSISSTRAGEQGDDYYVVFNGKRQCLEWHLKANDNRESRYCFRAYFFWCEENKQVVVGHLPSHLDTRAT